MQKSNYVVLPRNTAKCIRPIAMLMGVTGVTMQWSGSQVGSLISISLIRRNKFWQVPIDFNDILVIIQINTAV